MLERGPLLAVGLIVVALVLSQFAPGAKSPAETVDPVDPMGPTRAAPVFVRRSTSTPTPARPTGVPIPDAIATVDELDRRYATADAASGAP